jgi:hypothetical protein
MSLQFIDTNDFVSGLSPDDQVVGINLGDDQNQSTIIGNNALLINEGNLNTVLGFEAGRFSCNADSNILIGYRTGYFTDGDRNTFIGNYAGYCNVDGFDNMYLGMDVAKNVGTVAEANILMGNFTGANSRSLKNNNVLIGHSNTVNVPDDTGEIKNNVSLGAISSVQGGNVVSIGYSNRTVTSDSSIIVGTGNLIQSAPKSVVIGGDITNRGRGSVIMQPNLTGGYVNEEPDHLNIKNVLMGNRVGVQNSFYYDTLLTGDNTTVKSRSASSCNFLMASPHGVFLYSDDTIRVDAPLTEMSNLVRLEDLTVTKNAQVKGKATFDSNIVILSANGGSDYWLQYVNPDNELVFESKHGTMMTLIDEFRPEVLNFTGKHRCRWQRGSFLEKLINERNSSGDFSRHFGKIVVASGTYCDLDGNEEISIDEAVPEIDISLRARDKRVFGVIGGFVSAESEESHGKKQNYTTFHIGNVAFRRTNNGKEMDPSRVIVQSVGEGAIQVCDINGPIENGDFITTSDSPGMGMRQDENYVMNSTVARATCDCDFSDGPTAMIGCTYCC